MAEKDTSKGGCCSGYVAEWSETAFFSLEAVGVLVQIPAWLPPFCVLSSFFLPFGFLLFILTADLVSFAKFLRKRISSFRGKQGALLEAICENNEPRGRQVDFLRERAWCFVTLC